jgi:hypothetical protein
LKDVNKKYIKRESQAIFSHHLPLNQSILLIILFFLVVLIYVLAADVVARLSRATLVGRVHHQIVFHVLSLANLCALCASLEPSWSSLLVYVHYPSGKTIVSSRVASS